MPVILMLGYLGFVSYSTAPENVKNLTASNVDGKTLFEQKCNLCHRTSFPQTEEDQKSMQAPPIMAVMNHVNGGVTVKEGENKREKVIAFIVDYAQHPSKDKSFCEKHAIERFGVMPSQEQNVTPDELNLIANYLCDTYLPKETKSGHSCGSGKKSCGGSCKH